MKLKAQSSKLKGSAKHQGPRAAGRTTRSCHQPDRSPPLHPPSPISPAILPVAAPLSLAPGFRGCVKSSRRGDEAEATPANAVEIRLLTSSATAFPRFSHSLFSRVLRRRCPDNRFNGFSSAVSMQWKTPRRPQRHDEHREKQGPASAPGSHQSVNQYRPANARFSLCSSCLCGPTASARLNSYGSGGRKTAEAVVRLSAAYTRLKSLCENVAADVRRRMELTRNAGKSVSSRRRLRACGGLFTQAL